MTDTTDTTTSALSMESIIAAAEGDVADKKRKVSIAKGQLTKANNALDRAQKRVDTAHVAVDQALADLEEAEKLVAMLRGESTNPRRSQRRWFQRGSSGSEQAETDATSKADSQEPAPTSDTSTGGPSWLERMLNRAAN
ncbi:hypothetical protein KDA23_00690 [Candidatus Saccharibacteria bacterium]|nr:hypothetical protein [Candidatus Saccharibacteria bacterium]